MYDLKVLSTEALIAAIKSCDIIRDAKYLEDLLFEFRLRYYENDATAVEYADGGSAHAR